MSLDVSNLRPTIVPKSDQLNADQIVGGPLTVTVTLVLVLTETELELVEMLERLLAFNDFLRPNGSSRLEVENEAEALIKKVRGAA